MEKAKYWVGGNDKSLRILFLTFATESNDLSYEEQTSYLEELVNYTSPNYESSVRQNAFVNLFSMNLNEEILLKNLVNATTHHKWQFTKYARDKIRILLTKEENRKQFEHILSTLKDGEKTNLQNLLNEKP